MEIKKRKLCLVHIGMPKTGSSTLQDAFFSGLDDPRVSYANLPHPNQSGWLYGLFVKDPLNYHFFKEWGMNSAEDIKSFQDKSRAALIQGFRHNDTDIELLSGEDLFHLHEQGVEELKLFLQEYFEHVIIVAYVRPLKAFLESAFQQQIKQAHIQNMDARFFYHRYKNFSVYDKVFGRDNVKLFKFEPSTFFGGDIVYDFCLKLDLLPTKSKVKVVNESLTKEAISILFAYNFYSTYKTDFGASKYIVQNQLVEDLRCIGKEKFNFSGEYLSAVLSEFREDYDWIRCRMGAKFDEVVNYDSTLGISNENELLDYSTNYIDELVQLTNSEHLPFSLEKTPQTIAKLVDFLAQKIFATTSKQ